MAQSETRCECGHAHEGQDECGAYGCGCEQFRPAAPPDTRTDARLREAADPEAVRLIAQLLAGVRDGFTNSEAADLTQRAEAWLLRAALPPDPRPEEPQR